MKQKRFPVSPSLLMIVLLPVRMVSSEDLAPLDSAVPIFRSRENFIARGNVVKQVQLTKSVLRLDIAQAT
ncbi:hypothetical protein HNQ72_003445 [Rhizobium wenxiniae]|uniref:Uncharacterized protein n=1 Tax=Rhizobium wenxiniae TaxID=1737357 RepID=A0A7W9Y7U7_9HYPH|nr:hypothetical protein [Rhizobium wenxiniae]